MWWKILIHHDVVESSWPRNRGQDVVHGFAEIAKPLNELLKKDADVNLDWTSLHDSAMEKLKEKLATVPVLAHDDGVSPLEMQTDASGKGLGAVLYIVKGDVRKPIAYASRRLDGAEERYHVNELEFLAVLWALRRFNHHSIADMSWSRRTAPW